MSKCLYLSLVLILSLLAAGPLLAAEGDGGYAGAFFQVPIGARPTAMGGAYLAISDDGAAPRFNPAGIAGLKKRLYATSYRATRLGRRLGYMTVLFPTMGNSALGLHWLYAGSGSVMARNRDGDPLGHELSLTNHDFSIMFAKRFETVLSAGVKLYYLHSSFADMTAFSVGVDMGLMFYIDGFFDRESRDLLPVRDMRVGLTVKYLEAEYIWNNEEYLGRHVTADALGTEQKDKVPIELGVGASARFMDRKLLLAADLLKNMEQGIAFHGGAEYRLTPEFMVRGGFSDGRFTAGTGYVFGLAGQVLAIDYAFSTDKADEGLEHIFSFDLLF